MITLHHEGPNLMQKPHLLTFKSISSGCHSSSGLWWTFNTDDGALKNANMIYPSRNVYRKISGGSRVSKHSLMIYHPQDTSAWVERRWRANQPTIKDKQEKIQWKGEGGGVGSGPRRMWKWEVVAKGEWWVVDLWAFWYLNHPRTTPRIVKSCASFPPFSPFNPQLVTLMLWWQGCIFNPGYNQWDCFASSSSIMAECQERAENTIANESHPSPLTTCCL